MATVQPICALTKVSFTFEFKAKPTDNDLQAMKNRLVLSTDKVDWDEDDDPSSFYGEDTAMSTTLLLDVRPCSQSLETEGDLDDIGDNAVADLETPQELLDRLTQARTVESDFNCTLASMIWASELTPRPYKDWTELENED